MPRAKRNLKNRVLAQAKLEMVLRLTEAGRYGIPIQRLLSFETFAEFAAYSGEPHKKFDRLTDDLSSAGYMVERFGVESPEIAHVFLNLCAHQVYVSCHCRLLLLIS